MKEKHYMQCRGPIESRFEQYIDKSALLGGDNGFTGKIKGNKFWFYKRSAFKRNSFVIILDGEIIDNQVCYIYRKSRIVAAFMIIYDIAVLSFLLFALYTHSWSAAPKEFVLFPIVLTIMHVLMFVYPKKEKEALYERLQLICGQKVGE